MMPMHVSGILLGWMLCTGAVASQIPVPLPTFEKRQLTDKYYAEGANAGDLDRDGHTDLVSGPFWWRGPDFRDRRLLYAPLAYSIGTYAGSFFSFPVDVNGDGWLDVVVIGPPGGPAGWLENPKQFSQNGPPWNVHLLHASVGGESPTLTDLVAGGPPELLCVSGGRLGYLKPDPAGATRPWLFVAITQAGPWSNFAHGLGIGDVNKDGRLDVLTALGWLEQPKSLAGDPPWIGHPFPFSRSIGGAQMFAYDVDGDGDNDVITSLDAHGYGLSWFEQVVVRNQVIFQEHVILPPQAQTSGVQFSQLHSVDLRDMDGDGLMDIVTGKTFWAHNGNDPGAKDPAVLYWFRLERQGGKVTFTPRLVDDDSGIGRQVVATDMDGDGRPDIVAGNKKGIFLFVAKRLTADVEQLSLRQAGTQNLTLDAGRPHGSRLYWIFGSVTGSSPGIVLGGRHVPLNPDPYTDFAIAFRNTPLLGGFTGRLDRDGRAQAAFRVPSGLPVLTGFTLFHAFVAYDGTGTVHAVSNPVSLRLF